MRNYTQTTKQFGVFRQNIMNWVTNKDETLKIGGKLIRYRSKSIKQLKLFKCAFTKFQMVNFEILEGDFKNKFFS